MSYHHESQMFPFGSEALDEGGMFDLETVYQDDSDREFLEDERDFEDVDDLDELLNGDPEADRILEDGEDIPDEDLVDHEYSATESFFVEEEEEDEFESYSDHE